MAAAVDAGYGCDDFGCNGGVQDWYESPGYPSRSWAETGPLQASKTSLVLAFCGHAVGSETDGSDA